MDIELKCYGTVREVVGSERVELTVPEGATVSDALDRLDAESADGEGSLLVMRDGAHLDPDTALADGDCLNVSLSPFRD
jgi:molybdopterin converting factor small subunit